MAGVLDTFKAEVAHAIGALEKADSLLESPGCGEIPRVHRSIRLAIRLLCRASEPTHELEVEEVELEHSIKTILEMLDPYLKGIEVNLQVADEARSIRTSEIDLLRILGNLIKNAAEALRNSKKEKKIEIKVFANGEDEVGILVADTGPGLPEDMRDDPFCTQARSKKGKDHGFGLPSIREESDLLNGEIRLASTSESGTSFLLTLPRDPDEKLFYNRPESEAELDAVVKRILHDVRNGLAGAQSLATSMEMDHTSFDFAANIGYALLQLSLLLGTEDKKDLSPRENVAQVFEEIAEILKERHVVLIDDDPVVRKVAFPFFTHSKPKSLKVTSTIEEARAALAAIPEGELEKVIFITDNTMPEMNGKDLARLMRRLYPTIKILLCSGSQQKLEDIEENPFNGSLKKPFTAVDFLEALKDLFPQGAQA